MNSFSGLPSFSFNAKANTFDQADYYLDEVPTQSSSPSSSPAMPTHQHTHHRTCTADSADIFASVTFPLLLSPPPSSRKAETLNPETQLMPQSHIVSSYSTVGTTKGGDDIDSKRSNYDSRAVITCLTKFLSASILVLAAGVVMTLIAANKENNQQDQSIVQFISNALVLIGGGSCIAGGIIARKLYIGKHHIA